MNAERAVTESDSLNELHVIIIIFSDVLAGISSYAEYKKYCPFFFIYEQVQIANPPFKRTVSQKGNKDNYKSMKDISIHIFIRKC